MLLTSFVLCFLFLQVRALPGYSSDYPPGPCPTPPPSGADDPNYKQKLGWFLRFADAFMYPNNTIEAAKINSTLFAENIQGRVDLTSTFDGRELNTEVFPPPCSRLTCSISLDYFRRLRVKLPLEYSIFLVFQRIILSLDLQRQEIKSLVPLSFPISIKVELLSPSKQSYSSNSMMRVKLNRYGFLTS
jgi:hypothetical protein